MCCGSVMVGGIRYRLSVPPHIPSSMHSGSPNKKRHEVWNWFIDEETQTGNKSSKHGKVKVYCLRCLDAHMDGLRESDDQSGLERNDSARYKQCE